MIEGIKIDWLGNVYAIGSTRRIGCLVCGPNPNGSFTVRLHHEDSWREVPASLVAIQWNQGKAFVAA